MEKETAEPVRALKAHVAINVRNVEESIDFYRKMLGIEPAKVRTGYAKFDVENPPLNLTLNERPFTERGALSHLGIQLSSSEDVLAMRRKWADANLITRDEMQTNCCYAVQDKTWVHDPDGNEWEAFVVLEDNLAETEMCCVTGETEQSEAARTYSTTATTASDSTLCCAPGATSLEASSCCGGTEAVRIS